jgi:hypothetical protein
MKTRALPALLAATLVSSQTVVARAQPATAPAVAQPALPPAPPPTPSPPAPLAESEEANIHVLGAQDDSDVQLLSWTNHGYEAVCTAPCYTHLSRATHRFALSREGGKAIAVAEPVTVSGPVTIRATYQSRKGMRTAGVVILVASAGAMLVGVTIGLVDWANSFGPDLGAGLSGNPSPASSSTPWEVVAVIGLVGTLVSVPLILAPDHATVEIVPATTARIFPGATREGAFVPASDSHGLALRVRF